MKNIFAFLAMSVLFSACTTIKGPKYSELPILESNSAAILIVNRVATIKGSAWSHNIYIDKKLVAKLETGCFTRLLVEPGTRLVSHGPESDPTFRKLEIDFKPGKTYFIEHDPGWDLYTPGSFVLFDNKSTTMNYAIFQTPLIDYFKD